MTGTIIHHAATDSFDGGLRAFFEYRDLGIASASDGKIGAHVIRATPGEGARPEWHIHELDFQMVYILKGWVEFEYEDAGFVRLEAGASVYQPPRIRHREIRHSDDIEMLEITAPAAFVTKVVPPPASAA